MRVVVSPEAVSYIRKRGGSLYLWNRDFGRGWETDGLATEAPADVAFEIVHRRGVRVYFERAMERPTALEIHVRKIPSEKLKVTWDGETWGTRGGMEGAI